MSTLPPDDQNGGAVPPPPPPPPSGGYGGYGEGYGAAYGGGTPPPPPPAGPAGGSWSVGDALSWGWAKFQANVAQILIAALILFVAIVVVEGIGFGIRLALVHPSKCEYSSDGGLSCTNGSGFIISLLASAIMGFLFFVGAQIVGAMVVRGALDVAEGQPFQIAGLFQRIDLGKVVIASLITGAIVFVGSLLCYLPGLIAAFLLSYTLYFVVDQGLEPMDAVKASFNLVKDNVGNTIIWFIVSLVVTLIGACLCGVGLLVAAPVVVLGTAYTYKKLSGQTVVA